MKTQNHLSRLVSKVGLGTIKPILGGGGTVGVRILSRTRHTPMSTMQINLHNSTDQQQHELRSRQHSKLIGMFYGM